jgi:hypothetical protein
MSLSTIDISSYEKLELGICPKLLNFLYTFSDNSNYCIFHNLKDFYWSSSRSADYRMFIKIIKNYNINYILKIVYQNDIINFYQISILF